MFYALKAQLYIYAWLSRFKKVYVKIQSKKYHLIKQGLRELKAKEKKESKIKITYIAKVEFINTFNPYLLPSSGFFNFDCSFSILPDIISDNMPVLFFIKSSKFSFSFYIVSLNPSY